MLPYNKICIIKGSFCSYGENVPRVGCCVACNCPYQYHCRGEYIIAMLILQCLLINWYISYMINYDYIFIRYGHSLDYVCFGVRHTSVSNTDTIPTPVITLNYVIFLNYYRYRSVCVVFGICVCLCAL